MSWFLRMLKPWFLHLWALLIAVVLWLQVHGQGEGSLSLDVPLQIQGLPANMVIVNNLPNQVRITVKGWQARLKTLADKDVFVSLMVSDLSEPGVIERSLNADSIHLPAGLVVEKMQPDRLELQVDRIITKVVPVRVEFNLPQEWKIDSVTINPSDASLQGPEVWLESLKDVEAVPVGLALKAGEFEVQANIVTPAGKAVHLEEADKGFTVRGILSKKVDPVAVKPSQVLERGLH